MSSGAENTTKVIFIALLANLGIAIAKFIGAIISKSASMLAEAIHSLVDSSNQALLLLGSKQSKRPPTSTHPLGHGREAFFWSFIVAILLFSIGGLFAIYEGVHKLQEPSELRSPLLSLSILFFSLVVEAYSFWACFKEVKAQNKFGSLWSWFRKTTSSELLVVFTEDLAALVGLLLAIICLLISWTTGQPIWDAIGSILVGSMLVVVAVLLAFEIKSLIVGEAPSDDYKKTLEDLVENFLPTGKVIRFISLLVGPNDVMISCKIHPGKMTLVSELVLSINSIEREMKVRHPEIKWQFVEPDTID